MKNLNEMFLVAKCKGSSWFRRARSKFPCFFYAKCPSIRSALVARNVCQQMKWKMLMLSGRDIDRRTLLGAAHFSAAVVLSACSQGNVDPAGYDPQLFCFLCWFICLQPEYLAFLSFFFAPHTTRPPFTFRRVFPVSGATCAERRTEFASSFPSPSFFPPFGLKFRVFVSNQPWMRRHVCAVLALCLDEWHEMNEMYKIRWRQPLGWGKYRMIGITIYTRRNAIYSAHHCHLVIHSTRFVSKFTAFFVSSLKELCQKEFFSSIIFSNAPAPGDLSLGFQLLNICSRRGECFLGKTFGFARTVRSLK